MSLPLLSELSISPGLLAAGIGSGSTRFLLALTFFSLIVFGYSCLQKKTYHHASAQILTHGHQSPSQQKCIKCHDTVLFIVSTISTCIDFRHTFRENYIHAHLKSL